MDGQDREPITGELVPAADAVVVRTFHRGGRALDPFARHPEELLSDADQAFVMDGVPESTRTIYRYQWGRFVRWCGDDSLGPPHPVESVPATPATVVKYIRAHATWTNAAGQLAGRGGQPYAPDTVRLALAVISVAHKAHGLASPTGSEIVIKAMRSYARSWAKQKYKRAVAYAPTPDEIIAMVDTCDLSTAAGLRDALLIRLQAEIGRRNSEMMELDIADLAFPAPDRMLVHIRFSKTNPDGTHQQVSMVEADIDRYDPITGELVSKAWHPETCPVRLAKLHLRLLRDRGYTEGPAFHKIHSGQRAKVGYSGKILPERMDRKNYQDVITRCARESGVDHDPETGELREVVPHSLRAAFATNGSAAGVPLGLICDQGGWSRSSPVVLEYQRFANRWGANNPGLAIRNTARNHTASRGEAPA